MIFIKNNDHNYYWSLIKSNKTNLWFIKDKDQICPLSHQSQNSQSLFLTNITTVIPLSVYLYMEMYHLSIRSGHPVLYWAQLWLISPEWDKFYDCNKNQSGCQKWGMPVIYQEISWDLLFFHPGI